MLIHDRFVHERFVHRSGTDLVNAFINETFDIQAFTVLMLMGCDVMYVDSTVARL